MCCLFGLLDTRRSLSGDKKTALLYALATAAEVRGKDASGLAYHTHGKLVIQKKPVPGHLLRFRIPDDTAAVMGHTRMTTQGSERFNRNNHPFIGETREGHFALAHNGVIWNDKELRKSLELPVTNIETDSYIAVQLIEQRKTLDFSSLRYMAEQVEGSFTFTVLDAEDSLYIVKGDSPLYLIRYPNRGLFVYASTEEILQAALKAARLSRKGAEQIETGSGEIVKLNRKGEITRGEFDDTGLYRTMWDYPRRRVCGNTYPDELKSVAAWMGYPPEMIDRLLSRGHTLGEVEELLYAGEI